MTTNPDMFKYASEELRLRVKAQLAERHAQQHLDLKRSIARIHRYIRTIQVCIIIVAIVEIGRAIEWIVT